jgi:FkbM family methyltransferase
MFIKKSKFLACIIIAVIILIVTYIRINNAKQSIISSEVNTKRHVFFDLGTNNGNSILYFLSENTSKSENDYLKGYGSKNNVKWEIYAVEANPIFNKTLEKVKEYCQNLGHSFYLYKQTAAWIKNEKLKFFIDTVNVANDFWGSSLVENHPDVLRSNKTSITVNGIDIAELLKKYDHNDEIVMKIDIEGTEYPLLRHLIKKDVLSLVDVIAVEYHDRFIKNETSIEDIQLYFKKCNIKSVSWY